jgi:hypothetical protein
MVLIFVLLIFALLGIYYSGIGIVILQFREFKYLLLLIIVLPYNKIEDYKYFWPILKVMAGICVPVSIIQWIIFQSNGDYVTGVLGYKQSGTMSFFLLIIFFTEFMLRLTKNQRLFGYFYFWLLPTAINETKITIILIPIMLFTALLFSRKLNIKYIIGIGLFLIVFFIGYSMLYDALGYTNSFADAFSYNGLQKYFYASQENWGTVDAGRMTKILWALDTIKTNPFFGFGLGAAYGGATSGLSGYIFKSNFLGDTLGGTKQQLVLSLIDLGILGTIIVLFLLIVFFVKVLSVKELSSEKILAFNSSIIVFVAFPYSQIFYLYQIMFIYILSTFICLRVSKVRNHIDN